MPKILTHTQSYVKLLLVNSSRQNVSEVRCLLELIQIFFLSLHACKQGLFLATVTTVKGGKIISIYHMFSLCLLFTLSSHTQKENRRRKKIRYPAEFV
jgi:hypothetical protein